MSKALIWSHVPIGIIQRSENQEIEAGMAPFTISTSDPLGKFVLPIPATLDPVGLEILFPCEETLPPEVTASILINYNPRLPGYFDLLVAKDQQKRRAVILAGTSEPNHLEEVRLLLHSAT